jgi:hypothetical protein
MLAGLAYWGFTTGDGALAWVLGIGAPVLAAVIWGLFVAPKAKRPVSLPVRLSIEIDLFVVTALALWFADARSFALALGSLGIATSILNAFFAGPVEPA